MVFLFRQCRCTYAQLLCSLSFLLWILVRVFSISLENRVSWLKRRDGCWLGWILYYCFFFFLALYTRQSSWSSHLLDASLSFTVSRLLLGIYPATRLLIRKWRRGGRQTQGRRTRRHHESSWSELNLKRQPEMIVLIPYLFPFFPSLSLSLSVFGTLAFLNLHPLPMPMSLFRFHFGR